VDTEAESCTWPPTDALAFAGETTTFAGTLSVTVSGLCPATPSLVAYTVALPIFRALRIPPEVTDRMEVSLVDHATGAEGTGWPASFMGVAAAVTTLPTSRLATGTRTATVMTPLGVVGGLGAPESVGALRSTHAISETTTAAMSTRRPEIGARIETLRSESVRRPDWRGASRCAVAS
jgi:hypothetical protein